MAEGVRREYAVVEFEREEVAPDEMSNVGRKEGIFPLYPEFDFYTIAAWGWAYQPIIDALDRLGMVDMEKIIVTGHSRGGQAAMAASGWYGQSHRPQRRRQHGLAIANNRRQTRVGDNVDRRHGLLHRGRQTGLETRSAKAIRPIQHRLRHVFDAGAR